MIIEQLMALVITIIMFNALGIIGGDEMVISDEIITRGLTWNNICYENSTCILTNYMIPINYINEFEWIPINTTIIPSYEDEYDYEVIAGIYQIYFKENPSIWDTAKYESQNGTFYYSPHSLTYRNAWDDEQWINTIQSVRGYPIEHIWETEHIWHNITDTMLYPNAFGYNTNLTYLYTNKLLKLKLHIEPNDLPEIKEWMLEAPNITLDMDFQIDYPSDVDIYINNELWDRENTKKTKNRVDFKINNQTIFFLPKPRICEKFHWGGDGNLPVKNCTTGEYVFKKMGNKLYTILKTPYEFINNSDYLRPLEIDPSIEVSVIATSDDAGNNNVAYDEDDATYYLSTTDAGAFARCGWRFLGITIPQGATIDTGVLEFRGWTTSGFLGTSKSAVHGVDEDNASTWAETTNEPKDATLTDAFDTHEWTGGDTSNGVHFAKRFDDIVAIVQEIVDRGGWESGNAMAFYTKDNGTGLGWHTSAHTYDHVSIPAPKVTISYTVDTCTYSGSGNWDIDCNDNCTISTNTDVSGNLTVYGDQGSLTLDANVTCNNKFYTFTNCKVVQNQNTRLIENV